jgi:uroporphyrinogen-III decarboxylase
MTSRERIISTLNGQETDRLPWAPLVDEYFAASLPEMGCSMQLQEVMRLTGCDFIQRHVASPIAVYSQDIKIVTTDSHDGISEKTCIITPIGSIYSIARKTGITRLKFIEKHFIECIEDAIVYQYVCENSTFQTCIDAFEQRDLAIGDDGIATVTGKISPIQHLLQFACGVENTIYLLMDYPDEMKSLMQKIHQQNIACYQCIAQYPTKIVFAYEDTSSTVMSPSMYLDYSFNQINDYADIMHESGKIYITHMCGKLKCFKDFIGKGRQDGFDSICPPTTGDLTIWDARAAFGESKLLIGGIEPPFLSRSTPQECEKEARTIVEKMKEDNRFILSTGDATPYGTPLDNLMIVSKVVAECR